MEYSTPITCQLEHLVWLNRAVGKWEPVTGKLAATYPPWDPVAQPERHRAAEQFLRDMVDFRGAPQYRIATVEGETDERPD